MEIEVLIMPGCPHRQLAEQRLRQALDEAGLTATVFTTRVIDGPDEAERYGFTGSPTILIDGRDPFAEPGTGPSLACRLYRTPAGPAGVPDAGLLRRALEEVAGTGA